jgi:hypothetical protein
MPIKACADHLKSEITSGTPGKQYENLLSMSIPDEEIADFQDP